MTVGPGTWDLELIREAGGPLGILKRARDAERELRAVGKLLRCRGVLGVAERVEKLVGTVEGLDAEVARLRGLVGEETPAVPMPMDRAVELLGELLDEAGLRVTFSPHCVSGLVEGGRQGCSCDRCRRWRGLEGLADGGERFAEETRRRVYGLAHG